MTQNAITPQATSILETMSARPAAHDLCQRHSREIGGSSVLPGWASLRQVVGSPSNTRAEMSRRGDFGQAGLSENSRKEV